MKLKAGQTWIDENNNVAFITKVSRKIEYVWKGKTHCEATMEEWSRWAKTLNAKLSISPSQIWKDLNS
jgi:hypothetical protein